MREGKCIVIGAGDLTVGSVPYEKEVDYVIAVDGGLMYCELLKLEPDLIIGDFDSIDENWQEALDTIEKAAPEKVKRLNPEKDDTDMLAALKEGLALGYRNFYLYGATGGRFEHTFANIQSLLFLKKQDAAGYIMDGAGMTFVMENEEVSFRKEMEGYLSIFTLGREAKGVTLTGLKYPLENYTLTNDFPIGISNEFIGEIAKISVENGQLVIMVSWCE